ncbi:hypothetical protein ACP4OV_015264 [Aristida adscensionis]
MAPYSKLGSGAGAAAPPSCADGVELQLQDPVTPPPHLAMHIPDVDDAVHEDGRTAVVETDHPAEPQGLSLEDFLACFIKTMLKAMYIVIVVSLTALFVQDIAATKMTWTKALQVILFGASLALFFLLLTVALCPDEVGYTVPPGGRYTVPVQASTTA